VSKLDKIVFFLVLNISNVAYITTIYFALEKKL